MKEIKAIISAYDKIDKIKSRAALATVVRVEGSSYRRTGARMLVADDGVWVGGISGGCLEGDALKQARAAIYRSAASLVTYDTSAADAYQIGVGLGCNGVIDVLFTPLRFGDKNNPVEVLKSCLQKSRQTHILLTVTGLEGNWDNISTGNVVPYTSVKSLELFGEKAIIGQLHKNITRQAERGRSAPLEMDFPGGKKLALFIEILPPEIHLVLMGHQYDVYPMARLAKEVGAGVTIAANPLKLRLKEINFSFAQLQDIRVDDHTAIVLMAHDFKTDKANLLSALQTRVSYIGMLGPRLRAEKIFDELTAEGHLLTDEDMKRIYAPAGLDIGSVNPEEIALSILAEIKAVFSEREGGSLRLRRSAIHQNC